MPTVAQRPRRPIPIARCVTRAVVAAAISFAAVAPALAQQAPGSRGYVGSCRPPLKFAAGACVARCPAGFEDSGSSCTYRSTSGPDH